MRQLDLTEHAVISAVPLSPAQARVLQEARFLTVTPSAAGADHWDVRPSSFVGVVRYGDLEVRIRPKLPVSRLLFLLAYARDQSGWDDILAGFSEAPDLVTAVAMGFVHHAERALTPHVLHGYLAVEDDLTTLRGRLREGDQLRRRFGIPLPVAVAYDEFTIDIPENRLLLTAGLRLQKLWGVPPAGQRALRRVIQRLEGVTELPAGSALPRVPVTRLNQQYGPALALADLVLRNLSFEHSSGQRSSVGFLFDMNRVFEDFLTAALTTELERLGGRVISQYSLTLDDEARVQLRPDLTWWHGHRCLTVMDAKYKLIAPAEMPNGHLYQMLAYCTALGVRHGWLIYAAGNAPPFIANVRHTEVTIRSAVVDLSQPPAKLLQSMRTLASRLMRHGW